MQNKKTAVNSDRKIQQLFLFDSVFIFHALKSLELFFSVPEIGEMHFASAGDTLDVFNVFKEYHDSDGGKADSSHNILCYETVNEGPCNCGSHGNEADIVRYEGDDDLAEKHYKEHSPVEGKNNSAEARKPLTALKAHIEGQDMTEDTRASRQSKGELEVRERRFRDRYRDAGLSYIEDSAGKADGLSEKDNGIGRARVMRAPFSDIKPVDLGDYVRWIYCSDTISDEQTKKIFHAAFLLSQLR